MLARPAVLAIDAYQRYVSPYKGYSCAYRIAHGGTGCSGFAKQAIREVGLQRALPKIKERFAACKKAAAALSARTADDERKDDGKLRWHDYCSCMPCDVAPCPGRGASSGIDCVPDCCSF